MTNKLYDKLKNVQNLVFTFAVLRNKFIEKNKESLLDEYKYQIIKEEFLDFTPTPKKEEKDLESFDAYSKNVLYNSSALKKAKSKKFTKKIKNQSKLFSHPDIMIKTKPHSLYPNKHNSRFLNAGGSFNPSLNHTKSSSKKRKLSSGRPLSSKLSKKAKIQTIKSTKMDAKQLNAKASTKMIRGFGKSKTSIPNQKKRKLPPKRID